MTTSGLINAFDVAPTGTAQSIDWGELATKIPVLDDGHYLWVHLDWMTEGVHDWLMDIAGIDPTIATNLATRGTRPSVFFYDHGFSMNLRGVNLNAENDPADMISVRFWLSENIIITLRNQPLKAFDDIRNAIAQGTAPRSPDDFILTVAERLAYRVENVVRDLEEDVEAIEDLSLIHI